MGATKVRIKVNRDTAYVWERDAWMPYPIRLWELKLFRRLKSLHEKGVEIEVIGQKEYVDKFLSKFQHFLENADTYKETLKYAYRKLKKLEKRLPEAEYEILNLAFLPEGISPVYNPVSVSAKRLAKELGLKSFEKYGGRYYDFGGDTKLKDLFWRVAKLIARNTFALVKLNSVENGERKEFYVEVEADAD